MTLSTVIFSPLIPWPLLAAAAGLAAGAVLIALVARARGALLRAAGFAILAVLLAGPQLVRETTRPLPSVFLIAIDRSQSMSLPHRTALAGAALSSLRAAAAGQKNLQTRIVDIPPAESGGTALFASLATATQSIPPGQLAGIAVITDGEISDTPAKNPFAAPITALIPAAGEETDRELRLLSAPAYALAGQSIPVSFEVLDHGLAGGGAQIPVTVTEDGTPIFSAPVPAGTPQTIKIPVPHAGPIIIALAAAPLAGAVTAMNGQAAFTLTGIAKKLQVVLISGNPNQSERTWRLLLKSDPAVELVHFTILRTPSETLDAPPEAIALVPFPVQELFETDIGKFDLIILDEFDSAGLLPPAYLTNIASYVQNGGALLIQTGPEFSTPDSLAYTGLAPILPAIPAPPGAIIQSFSPSVTPVGTRDPVTAPFATQTLAPWQRLETAAATSGDTLMTATADNWPLLVLAGEGKGRVGMILSDQFWLWTRGPPHDGPALPLLRRVVHWLLREPALEAESLTASITNGQLSIRRQTLSAANPGDATITSPTGAAQTRRLAPAGPGLFTATSPAPNPGIYKITQGALTTYAALTEPNAQEFENLAATASQLRPIAQNIFWLAHTPAPPLAAMLAKKSPTAITGTRDLPLCPPLPAALLTLLLLAAAWWRERS